MSSIIFFFIFIPILSIILLSVNFIFAPHDPYKEKKTPFECGYHSFLSQNRTQFTISFFIFALLFLIFDLEIVLIYPFSVSSYANNIYGLIIMIIFTLIVTVGFIFELGKNALKIESKQTQHLEAKKQKNKSLNSNFKSLESSLFDFHASRKLFKMILFLFTCLLFFFVVIYMLSYLTNISLKESISDLNEYYLSGLNNDIEISLPFSFKECTSFLLEILIPYLNLLSSFYFKSCLNLAVFFLDLCFIFIMFYNYINRNKGEKLKDRVKILFYLFKSSFKFIKANIKLVLFFFSLLAITIWLLNYLFLSVFDLNVDSLLHNLIKILSIFPLVSILISYIISYYLSRKILSFKQAIKNITFTRFIIIASSYYLVIQLGVYSFVFNGIMLILSKVYFTLPEILCGFFKFHSLSFGVFRKLFYSKPYHSSIKFIDSYNSNSIIKPKKIILYYPVKSPNRLILSNYFVSSKHTVEVNNISTIDRISSSRFKKVYYTNPLYLKDGISSQLGRVNVVHNSTGSHAFISPDKHIKNKYVFITTDKSLISLIEKSWLIKNTITCSEKLSLPLKDNNICIINSLYEKSGRFNESPPSELEYSLNSASFNKLSKLELGKFSYKDSKYCLLGKPVRNLEDFIWNSNYMNDTLEYSRYQPITVLTMQSFTPSVPGTYELNQTQDNYLNIANNTYKIISDDDINSSIRIGLKVIAEADLNRLPLKNYMMATALLANDIFHYVWEHNLIPCIELNSRVHFDTLNNSLVKVQLDKLFSELDKSMVKLIYFIVNSIDSEPTITKFNPIVTWIYKSMRLNYPLWTSDEILSKANMIADELVNNDIYSENIDYVNYTKELFKLNEERVDFNLERAEPVINSARTPRELVDQATANQRLAQQQVTDPRLYIGNFSGALATDSHGFQYIPCPKVVGEHLIGFSGSITNKLYGDGANRIIVGNITVQDDNDIVARGWSDDKTLTNQPVARHLADLLLAARANGKTMIGVGLFSDKNLLTFLNTAYNPNKPKYSIADSLIRKLRLSH